ncbi:MAG TPA: amidase family protein, partial [Acidimicrobiales bacterium]|nr:amidase family protein [Acidimicrobiales bacterium]
MERPTTVRAGDSDVELFAARAVDLANLVRERRLSPVDVVRVHLDRIAAVEGRIRAFQVVLADDALAEAEALATHPDLDRLPLAGVPVAVKDNVDVRGAPSRLGSQATSDITAAADDELVARLRRAGCVIIGKTQMPELAVWPFTEPSAFSATRNPWDASRTPGGSTGGGAAAVASGMAALALGSDGGGSIRVPASCCGLVGLKPGRGVVPLAGGASQHWYGLTEFGPLARSVADVAAALDVLAGTSGYANVQPPDRPLRIAYSPRHFGVGVRVAPALRAAVEETAETLAAAGHTLVEARPPYPANLGLRFSRRWLAGISEDAGGLPEDLLEDRTRQMARRGRRLSAQVTPAQEDDFAAKVADWFKSFDLFLTPTLSRGPVPMGTWTGRGWVRTMLGVGNWVNTTPWNLAGLPAASIPFGSGAGL